MTAERPAPPVDIIAEDLLLQIPRKHGGLSVERMVTVSPHGESTAYVIRLLNRTPEGELVASPIHMRIRPSELRRIADVLSACATEYEGQ